MNNSKRNLKIVSIIILAMALVSLVWGIYGLVTLDTSTSIPASLISSSPETPTPLQGLNMQV